MAINDNGAYTKEVPLDNIETTISIVAKNAYHSTESSFLIARDKNADDIAKEEKAKKDAENAKNLANTEEFKTKCLSHWGGSFTPLKDYVKKNVKDPDSFEHIETGFINK